MTLINVPLRDVCTTGVYLLCVCGAWPRHVGAESAVPDVRSVRCSVCMHHDRNDLQTALHVMVYLQAQALSSRFYRVMHKLFCGSMLLQQVGDVFSLSVRQKGAQVGIAEFVQLQLQRRMLI